MKRTAMVTIGLIGVASMVAAQPVTPDTVAYGEDGAIVVSLSGVAGDPAAGKDIMSNRGLGNCVACHVVTDLSAAFQGNVGPTLDGVADRRDIGQLRGVVADAKRTFPDSVMPSFYKTSGFVRPGDAFTGKAASGELPPLLTAQQIEDVVAYLATLKE